MGIAMANHYDVWLGCALAVAQIILQGNSFAMYQHGVAFTNTNDMTGTATSGTTNRVMLKGNFFAMNAARP